MRSCRESHRPSAAFLNLTRSMVSSCSSCCTSGSSLNNFISFSISKSKLNSSITTELVGVAVESEDRAEEGEETAAGGGADELEGPAAVGAGIPPLVGGAPLPANDPLGGPAPLGGTPLTLGDAISFFSVSLLLLAG